MTTNPAHQTTEFPPGRAGPDVIDTADGLDRVMGDRDLYGRMLRRFRKDYHDGAAPIRTAFEARNLALAHRLSHTLKGAAGMIGARVLHQRAAALETALRTASGDEAAALDALAPALQEVLAALDALLDDGQPALSQAAPARTLRADPALLADLLDLLGSGDGAAIDVLDESETSLRMILGDARFEEVAGAANEFDYERALAALRRPLRPGER
jgi:HPt (histidine-containing phosphotransfer) domain-containing protein